ncbi:neuronal growth regulator 1-like [Penaeus monodon]|uniref:neuronal growth regulator 1-like n=1 Tax=Penaeus monodon TaxID=6687 RepID=UPI0018A6EC81|nr:neuronal growth regulator 1-like [Penaeus monodon]
MGYYFLSANTTLMRHYHLFYHISTPSFYHTITLPYSATPSFCHTLPHSATLTHYHSPYHATEQQPFDIPPNIVDSQSSGDMMVQEGANINLTCSATGTPMPSITWRREDHEPITINKTLRVTEYNGANLPLTKISRVDMAAYLCIARNGVPPIVSKRIQVSVDCEYQPRCQEFCY